MASSYIYLVSASLCLLCNLVIGFNLDKLWPLLHYGPEGSLFGYSVALHRENNVNWLLVGAPKDATAQPQVEEGGTVYKCPVTFLETRSVCEKIPLDTTGSDADEIKSFQYMGATVRSGGVDGAILACAPRYVWKTTNNRNEPLREPVGQCIITNSDFTVKEEYTPCRVTQSRLKSLQGITHCQAGFSGEMLENGETILLGTPGSYYMQGQLYLKTADEQRQTMDGDATVRDDNYRGYAVSYGEFTQDSDPDVVSGAPRAESLQGQVEVFSSTLESLFNFTGDQLGAYFGSEVITADVNGDGFDDVIVASPLYSDDRPGYMENWECGKITIFYQQSAPSMRSMALFKSQSDHILGRKKQGRFGYSMTSLGDINYDGFEDIAVGEPYGGPDGKGRVYIFNGNSTGLVLQPSEILSASADLGLTDVRTFGFSLDGKLDVDGNDYPDLLVGTYNSDFVALFRARPVVHIAPELSLDPEGLDLDVKDLYLEDGIRVTSFEVKLCFSYSGAFIPKTLGIIYTIELDTMYTLGSRALFHNDEAEDEPFVRIATVLETGQEECVTKVAYVKPNIVEKLAPIQVSVVYALENSTTLDPYELAPILGYQSQAVQPKQAFILNNCKDNLCIPNLAIKNATFSSPSIVVGSEELITLNLHIANDGEDAFQATLEAHIPEGLLFVRTENVDSLGISVTCSEDSNNNVIHCDLGNPLMPNFQLPFGLTLSTDEVLGDLEALEFHLNVTSQNAEDVEMLGDNVRNLSLAVEVKANVRINNASNPEQVQYFSEDSEDVVEIREVLALNQIGPIVEHVYDIRNDGPSIIGRSIALIEWPLYDSNDKYALYVIDVKPDTCNLPPDLENRDNLPVSATPKSYDTNPSNSRKRRDVTTKKQQPQTSECSFGKCVKFSCDVSQLLPGEGYDIRIRSRFWNQTFIASGKPRIEIRSTISVQVQEMPYVIAREYPSAANHITTTAVPEKPPQGVIPWWIILVAILAGLLLLFLIIIALWKCGFFKRKKYNTSEAKYNQVPMDDNEVNGKLAARI